MPATLITDGSRRDAHGFTLIEIIAALVIIGIMGAIAVTIFSSLDKYKLISEVEILKSHLRYAQSRAMSDTVPWGIAFSGDFYRLQKNGVDSGTLPNDDSYEHNLSISGVSVETVIVSFDNFGVPSADGIVGGTDITVSTTGGDSKTITVTANTGFIL